ncbi:MAG: DUF951 domain-containing protein [Oscillospiraceae bacterium]|nr:DUF951 domain-containing protein [Oscillospiraceae bacterium]
MNFEVSDIVILKKPHPCGGNEFQILRVGMDFKMRCLKCSHEIWLTRRDAEKRIKHKKEN